MKKRYSPDLARDAAECDANYIRLCRLIPQQQDKVEFAISTHCHEGIQVTIEVDERCRYTDMLSVRFNGVLARWEMPRVLQVRVYHDLTTAEVTACNHYHHLESSYTYPNDEMHLPDEKAQLNRFFGEILTHCLAHGRVLGHVYADDKVLQTIR